MASARFKKHQTWQKVLQMTRDASHLEARQQSDSLDSFPVLGFTLQPWGIFEGLFFFRHLRTSENPYMFGYVWIFSTNICQKDLELVSAAINGLDEKQWQRGMTLMCIWDSMSSRVETFTRPIH